MTKQIIFLLYLLFHSFTAHHCFAMETQQSPQNFVVIDNGLLTEIEAKIVRTNEDSDKFHKIAHIATKKDTLINLMQYRYLVIRSKTLVKRHYSYQLFCPIVLKENKNSSLENLGQLDPYQNKEVKEAIRQNKALYCTMHQGAIIYNLTQQPNIQISKQTKEYIEKLQKEYSEQVFIPSKPDTGKQIHIYGYDDFNFYQAVDLVFDPKNR